MKIGVKVALGMMALMLAHPVMAGTIAEAKVKEPKALLRYSVPASDAVMCIKQVPNYGSVSFTEYPGRNGTIDVAVIDAAGRAALYTIRTDGMIETRGRLGGLRRINETLAECVTTLPPA